MKAPVDSLPQSHRTSVAIARALVGWEDGASLLILDEPTATLPGEDVERLFEVIHRLRARGVSILYVSHHLDEVFELADRVTVLRDGRKIATVPVGELDHDGLVELIVGHSLEAANASDAGSRLGAAPHGARPDVATPSTASTSTSSPGEIVGIAGITGSGREDVLGLIAGQIPRDERRGDARRHADRQPSTAPGDRRRRRVRAGRAQRARHGRPDERAREPLPLRRRAASSAAAA